MIRAIFAIISGLIVAIFVVWLVQTLIHYLFPPPSGIDLTDPAQLTSYVRSLPFAALLLLLSSYALGVLAGGGVAVRIAGSKPLLFAALVGAFVLAGATMNLLGIPHPAWFAISTVATVMVSAWLASVLGRRRSA